jgi:hypothetical protein
MPSPELWVPGYAGPLDDLIERIHRRIEQFAGETRVERPFVEIELIDGVRYTVESLSPEPGYGFVTIRPHPGEDVPAELIVQIGSIKRIELRAVGEQRGQFGFSVPSQSLTPKGSDPAVRKAPRPRKAGTD